MPQPLPKHQKVFDEIVMDSEDLQAIGPFKDTPTENLLKKTQDLIAAGQLDEDLLEKIECCNGNVLLDRLARPRRDGRA